MGGCRPTRQVKRWPMPTTVSSSLTVLDSRTHGPGFVCNREVQIRTVPANANVSGRIVSKATWRSPTNSEREWKRDLPRAAALLLGRLATTCSFIVAFVLLSLIVCAKAPAQDKLAVINAKGEVWVR